MKRVWYLFRDYVHEGQVIYGEGKLVSNIVGLAYTVAHLWKRFWRR